MSDEISASAIYKVADELAQLRKLFEAYLESQGVTVETSHKASPPPPSERPTAGELSQGKAGKS